MKIKIIMFSIIILILLSSCRKEIVSSSEYETAILSTTFLKNMPQLQSKNESELFKKHRIKSMSLVIQKTDSTELDSITFLEFDKTGRIIRRTTTENTTVGCLPYMLRQEFTYDQNKIRKVINYTFRHKASSVLENWMTRDTSRLMIFDWEDYSYNNDTTFVESGFAVWKFIKDANGNIVKKTTRFKTNNQLAVFDYTYSPSSIVARMESSSYDKPNIWNYTVINNIVFISGKNGNNNYRIENVYDKNGFLRSKIRYFDEEKTSEAIVTYSYY